MRKRKPAAQIKDRRLFFYNKIQAIKDADGLGPALGLQAC